ncbi:CHAT domain-containing protein [Sandarakinorhabdus sp.]|uniref:CHAT domain-containing protein n=1 Tax=Sandarakinorhabdus sp. TaxID=1916663 RepID=UPI00286D7E0C|nr:CHAT domain-containing protein [Sandarakinorhabdus sp.]
MSRAGFAVLVAAALALPGPGAAAPAVPSLKLADSFRIGNAGVLCTAQSRVADAALNSLFDRAYAIVCRDAAAPVGRLYAFRSGKGSFGGDAVVRLGSCGTPGPADIADLPQARLARCEKDGLSRSVYTLTAGRTLFVADGLSGYGAALRIGLQSLARDRATAGIVDVAATEAGDPAAFARVQAGSLDPAQALAEGYLRNNAASFAESSEFFDLLVERSRQGTPGFTRSAEYLGNQGLQQSNLGSFAEADRLFAQAAQAIDTSDPVAARLLRNAEAMHALNQRRPETALAVLDRPVSGNVGTMAASRIAQGFIDTPLSQRLNNDDAALRALGSGDARLSPEERAAILDAQALYLRGAALDSLGQPAAARAALDSALTDMSSVRGGKVRSIAWMRAAALTALANLQEAGGEATAARAGLLQAATLVSGQFPDSAAALAANARMAALLSRQGDAAGAASLFRSIVTAAQDTPGAGQVLRPLLASWFAQLASSNDPAAPGDFLAAAQVLVRPGVAQTQAVLARELSGGSDEAASLFRQSLTLGRDIVRSDADIARLVSNPEPAPTDVENLVLLRARTEALRRDQTAVLARLADFPRYRSITNNSVTLVKLSGALGANEAYYKLMLVGDDAYALYVTRGGSQLLRVGASASEIGAMVKALRDTIVIFENGRPTTYPFDALAARRLYVALFGPVADKLPAASHLIFEPDGAMLQLPINLLIAADTNVEAYLARTNSDAGDPFDMRGIAWLGRTHMVSTAVSPRAFLDVRAIPASKARRSYLGLGENAVPAQTPPAQTPATMTPIPTRADCDWPLSEWGRPVSGAELSLASRLLGDGQVVTGAGFSDDAIMKMADLKDYRVIHFATHGLVTAPRPECPARPALLTSFGGEGSDGLLSFRDIFDLSLDADTIILSACDTAGAASASATREAGITTGGSFALDGLVRAFVGAGARAVVASHWPVPDSYDATSTLISGLFAQAGQQPVGEALRRSQLGMMDAADTSHPYYWSGFAIIGDAAKPLSKTN